MSERRFIFALTALYTLLFPHLFGSSVLALPLIPAAFLITEKKRYAIFGLGLFGDLLFSVLPFGMYTLFLLASFWILKQVQRLLYVDTIFALALNVFVLTLAMNILQTCYNFEFQSILQKEFLFDPVKQGLFALFAYTLPMMALLPKEQKILKIFSLKT